MKQAKARQAPRVNSNPIYANDSHKISLVVPSHVNKQTTAYPCCFGVRFQLTPRPLADVFTSANLAGVVRLLT